MAKRSIEEKVRIRILPLRGIGGVGNAGDVSWMSATDADQYVKDGYVEIISAKEAEPVSLSDANNQPAEAAGDHEIMKPENKRL